MRRFSLCGRRKKSTSPCLATMFIGSVRRHLLIGHRAFSATAQQTTAPALAVQTSTLENNVIVATKGGEEEMVSFSISLAAGSRHESPSAPGASNFLKHALFMVLYKLKQMFIVFL